MKFPLSKRSIFFGGFATFLILLGVIGYAATKNPGKAEYNTYTVSRGALTQSVEVTGELSPAEEISLSFMQTGAVRDIFVSVGDSVEKGEILATLNARELEAEVSRAQAEIDLKLAGSTEEDIAIALAQVEVAQANLESAVVSEENAETSLTLLEDVTDSEIKEKELALEHAKINAETGVQDSEEDLLESLKSAVSSVRSALSKADEILGVENTLFNNDFERELSAADPSALTFAKNAFEEAADTRDLAEDTVYALENDGTGAEIETTIELTLTALQNTDETLFYTRRVLDATYADSVDLSLDDLVAFKANIDSARANVQTESQTVKNSNQAYANAVLTAEQSVESAEQSLKITKANAAKDLATAEANILTARATTAGREADLSQAQANYDKVASGPRSVDLAPLRASLKAAQAQLEKAQLIAPIDGRVTGIDISRGESASANTAAITMEASGSAFEVIVDVPESDISKVNMGDKAEITLDAFGDDVIFEGQVTSIEQAEKLIEGVVFYEARVLLIGDMDFSALRSGMSADVTIITEEKDAALFIPSRAILSRDGVKYVRVLEGSDIVEIDITAGLRGDDGFTEIVNGLEDGDEIIVSTKK